MNSFLKILLISVFLASCSSSKDLVYIRGAENYSPSIIDPELFDNHIEAGDILKIRVYSVFDDASIPYNRITNLNIQDVNLLKLDGYRVDDSLFIDFPVLGKISVKEKTTNQLSDFIKSTLVDDGHLINPSVTVKRLNSKFTILGEVRSPGTFDYFDSKINILQAIGMAGDLTIDGKRKSATLVRETDGFRRVFHFSLTDPNLLNKSIYYLKNNDVIIINPNFSKTKSAGFIGNPSSIASISSLLLSITLLILNKNN